MADERKGEPPQPLPRGWARHPKERMLITPLMAGVGGLLAFFVVVAVVVCTLVVGFALSAFTGFAFLGFEEPFPRARRALIEYRSRISSRISSAAPAYAGSG